MKKDKGNPVFNNESIDEILAEKVINHAEKNYNKKSSSFNDNKQKGQSNSSTEKSAQAKKQKSGKKLFLAAGLVLLIIGAFYVIFKNYDE